MCVCVVLPAGCVCGVREYRKGAYYCKRDLVVPIKWYETLQDNWPNMLINDMRVSVGGRRRNGIKGYSSPRTTDFLS